MPAASFAQYPNYLSPLNAECWYRFSSNDYNLPNWRYYAELYRYAPNNTTTPILMGRYKVAARPVTGEGLFSPHRQLKTLIKNSIKNNTVKLDFDSNMALFYSLKLGFGWNPKLTYGSNTSTGASRGTIINPVDYPNVVKPTGFVFGPGTYYYLRIATNQAHGLAVGDDITISKKIKGYHYYYDGTSKVRQVLTSTFIETNILYSGLVSVVGSPDVSTGNISTYIESGEIVDAVRINPTMSGIRAGWNGTRQYNQNQFDFASKYTFNQASGDFNLYNYLTPFPHVNKYKKIYKDQKETINFLHLGGGNGSLLTVKTYNANFGAMSTFTYTPPITINTLSYLYYTMETSIGTLLSAGQLNAQLNAGMKYYTVAMGIGSQSSVTAKFEVVERDCLYPNVRLCWLNKLGGYDYYNFSKEQVGTMNVSKNEMQKQLDYNYTTGERAQTVIMTEAIDMYSVNSDWLLDYEYQFLKELVSSPDVYMINETTGEKYPVIITDTSYRTKTQLKDMTYNMSINFKMANTLNIQSE